LIPEVEHILVRNNLLGEGPVWDDARGVLIWVDIDRCQLREFSPSTGAQTNIEMEVAVCALGLVAGSNDLVIATARGFAIWRRLSGVIDWIQDPESGRPGARLNDGAVDPQGNFRAGSLGPGFESSLYRLSPDRSLIQMESGLGVSNGMGWSPDGSRMYLTDSRRHTIYEYHYHPDTSTISSRKVF
jgi:sugar lactone lactonase YvrE